MPTAGARRQLYLLRTLSAFPPCPPTSRLPRERLPRHIAVIMDGNGRWAQRQGLPRIEGHRAGVTSVRRVTEECARLGIEQLTLYCLSSENWKRPAEELDFLLQLLAAYMVEERPRIMEHNIRCDGSAAARNCPTAPSAELDETVRLTRPTPACACAWRSTTAAGRNWSMPCAASPPKFAAGALDPAAIDEDTLSDRLYTAGMPDPDLLIRTAGEMRVSNFLLWQISYAEIWVTERSGPISTRPQLHAALRSYAARQRRFGGLTS